MGRKSKALLQFSDGFAIIEFIVGIAVLVVVGLTGYLWLNHSQSLSYQKTTATRPSPVPSPTPLGKIAFIRDGNIWLRSNGADHQLTNDANTSEKGIYQIENVYSTRPLISPDGKKITYMTLNTLAQQDGEVRYISNIDGSNKKVLFSDHDYDWGAAWAFNSQSVYVEKGSSTVEQNNLYKFDIDTLKPKLVTSYTYYSGCGGIRTDPGFIASSLEQIQIWYPSQLHASTDGQFISHNQSCGGVGVNEYSIDKNADFSLSKNLSHVAFAPDNLKIAGTADHSIEVFSSFTGKIYKNITLDDQPVSLLWLPDGSGFYYTTDKKVNDLSVTNAQTLQAIGTTEFTSTQQSSSIWKVELSSGKITKIKDLDAYDAKPLFINNGELGIVIIDNPNQLFDALNKGQVKNIYTLTPKAHLETLKLSNGELTKLIENGSEFTYSAN